MIRAQVPVLMPNRSASTEIRSGCGEFNTTASRIAKVLSSTFIIFTLSYYEILLSYNKIILHINSKSKSLIRFAILISLKKCKSHENGLLFQCGLRII